MSAISSIVVLLIVLAIIGAPMAYFQGQTPTNIEDYDVTYKRISDGDLFAKNDYVRIAIEPKKTLSNRLREAVARDETREYRVKFAFPPEHFKTRSVMFSAVGSRPHKVRLPNRGSSGVMVVTLRSKKPMTAELNMTPFIRGLKIVSIVEGEVTDSEPSASTYVDEFKAYEYAHSVPDAVSGPDGKEPSDSDEFNPYEYVHAVVLDSAVSDPDDKEPANYLVTDDMKLIRQKQNTVEGFINVMLDPYTDTGSTIPGIMKEYKEQLCEQLPESCTNIGFSGDYIYMNVDKDVYFKQYREHRSRYSLAHCIRDSVQGKCTYNRFGDLSQEEQLVETNNIISDVYALNNEDYALLKRYHLGMLGGPWVLDEDGTLYHADLMTNNAVLPIKSMHIAFVATILAIIHRDANDPMPKMTDIGDWSRNSKKLNQYISTMRLGELGLEDPVPYSFAVDDRIGEILYEQDCTLAANELTKIYNQTHFNGEPIAPLSKDRYMMNGVLFPWNRHHCEDTVDSLQGLFDAHPLFGTSDYERMKQEKEYELVNIVRPMVKYAMEIFESSEMKKAIERDPNVVDLELELKSAAIAFAAKAVYKYKKSGVVPSEIQQMRDQIKQEKQNRKPRFYMKKPRIVEEET